MKSTLVETGQAKLIGSSRASRLRHHRGKVITYGAAADRREVRLRAEIAETIVTDSMEA